MPKASGKKKSGSKGGSSNGKKSGSSSVGTSIRSSQQRAFRLRTDPSERLNRPRPRDSHEPDSIPLLDLSSSEDDKAERGRSTGLSALPPVIVPSKLPDTADLGESNISCCYDQKIEEYRELRNATQNVNFKVPVVSPGGIKFTRTVDFIWTTLFPGVQMTKTAETSGLSCGYMRISGYSVKPVEMVKDFTLILAVIDGAIVAKSSEIEFQRGNIIPNLVSKTLDQGCTMIVHSGSFYSLENWTDEECAVHFTMVRG